MTVQLQPLPAYQPPSADEGPGKLEQAWYYLLRTLWQRLGGAGATLPAQAVAPIASPYQYDSDISGTLVVQGGTVSEISIVRGTSNVITGQTSGAIPMLRGDTVSISYSVAPTLTFLPSEFVQN